MGSEMNGNGNGTTVAGDDPNHVKLSEAQLVRSEFGLSLEDCYKVAVKYYKEREKSGEITVPYDDRVKLMAYSKQVRNGAYSDGAEGAGWFDFVGNDVIRVWRELGQQSREDAMAAFVFLVDRVCPPFKNFISDQILPPPSKEMNGETSELRNLNGSTQGEGQEERAAASWQLFDAQRQHIQQALNAQTFHQFSAYAQRQFPGQSEQQAALIRQLQEQHYQQYMAQVYQQQAAAADPNGEKKTAKAHNEEDERAREEDSDLSDEEAGEDLPSNPAIAPASLWNRQDIAQFKNNIKKEGSEGILKIGHGETVTIRVPTHEDGSCLFWEFATDYYDIGFGVYFEWTIADSNQVSIHVSESDDEDELEDGEDAAKEEAEGGGGAKATAPGDVEAAPQTRRHDPNKPRQDEIIPVYRRDCHEEVYAGSHAYPGRGVYLLKFDNSYSLWRSKTLYYRVYYSK